MAFVRPSNDSGSGQGRIITAGDLTGVLTSLSCSSHGLRKINLMLDITRPAAGVTSIDVGITCSFDDSLFYPVQDRDGSIPPIMTLQDAIERKNISGAGTTLLSFTADVTAQFMRFTITSTAAVAGDVVDMDAYGLV